MAISKKTKKGSDLTITGALRKLSWFASATTTIPKNQRSIWYWDVIQKAEYEATSKFDKTLDVERYVTVILQEIKILNEKEIKKTQGA